MGSGPAPAARRVGPYRVEGELGRGGMGVVHRAFDERLHREVALKALPEELARDAEQLSRLEREARSLAAVSHPNVASIFGMEEADGVAYLVLELVPGETLRERLNRGALPLEEGLALCAQVAAGLAAVHRKGLVHRDLKPSNVMVTPEGTAKLLDFGLARQAREQARGEVTRHGEALGTPGWMSPEQLRGEELDARSDAWAWGCLLYECLAGAPAFPGETWTERDAAALTAEPDWGRLPELSAEVLALLRACLSKDRAGRPGTLDEVRRRLSSAGTGSTASRSGRRSSLPVERDAFVGRAAELQELGEQVAASRLVSALGLGGTGKTRLVLRFARERLEEYPGGAWFCDLSEARSVEGIAQAVATALDVPLGKDDPVVQLGHAIAGRGRCLVILDNFEQVSRHAEATLGCWLERCGEARFVVTTREVLGLPEEASLALAPLEPPDAVELFTARAQRVGRSPKPEDAETIARLVELLDRLPLAVELAAARTRVLSPQQLLERMGDRFRLLAAGGGRRDRQATLRATLDWSWELLSAWERAALAQASVFEGGFTLEAAEAVLDLSEHAEAPWAMDAVQALVEKSLIRRTAEDRFDLLVSVQEYAAEKLRALGAEAEASAAERHGRHFAGFGSDAVLTGSPQGNGTARRRELPAELDNVLAACRRAVARFDAETAVATLAAAFWVFQRHGPAAAAAELAESVRRIATEPALRARADHVLAGALWLLGRPSEAIPHCESALGVAREVGDRRHEGRCLESLGMLHHEQGRDDEAVSCLEAALVVVRELGDRGQEGALRGRLSQVHAGRGRLDEARACGEAALSIAREAGNRAREAKALGSLGLVYRREGNLEKARECHEGALAIAREGGDRQSEGVTLGNLGNLHEQRGRREEARACYEKALAISRDVGFRRAEGIWLGNLGIGHHQQGRSDEARACFEGALAIHREVGFRYGQGFWLRGLGILASNAGEHAEAVALFEQAVAAARGYPLLEAEFTSCLVRARLAAGDVSGARQALERAELLEVPDPQRAQLQMAGIRVLMAEGDKEGARAALVEADSLATRLGVESDSDLRSELAVLRAELDRPTPEDAP